MLFKTQFAYFFLNKKSAAKIEIILCPFLLEYDSLYSRIKKKKKLYTLNNANVSINCRYIVFLSVNQKQKIHVHLTLTL